MIALEPPGLDVLAEHLRDETWLDMRVVDVGTVQRVRLSAINIHRNRDVLVVEQKWAEGEDVRSDEFAIDAEDVRWLRETQVPLEEVKPIQMRVVNTRDPKHVIDEIIRTVAFLTEGVSEKDLRAGGKMTGCIRPRQEAMWLAYEMTDLAPEDIARKHFGYASQQPMLTVHQKIDRALRSKAPVNYNEGQPLAWFTRLRTARKLIDSNLGVRHCRTTDLGPWPCVL